MIKAEGMHKSTRVLAFQKEEVVPNWLTFPGMRSLPACESCFISTSWLLLGNRTAEQSFARMSHFTTPDVIQLQLQGVPLEFNSRPGTEAQASKRKAKQIARRRDEIRLILEWNRKMQTRMSNLLAQVNLL